MPRKKKVDENQIEMVIMEKPNGINELIISPHVPEFSVKTQDQVSSFISQNFLSAGEKILRQEKKGRIKQQLRTKVSFSYEGVNILTRMEFNLFDQEVHDAVVSLYLANNKVITPSMVYRAMTGKTHSEYIHNDRLKEIEDSIDKCLFSKLSIDASEEAAVYGYDQAIYSGALLAAEKVLVKLGGNRVVAYNMLSEPLLYKYAKACDQVTAVDLKLLDTPISKTVEIIMVQGYLLRKIEQMKHDRTCERLIYMQDIYELLGVAKDKRVKQQRLRGYINEMLDYWVENQYIGTYEINRKARVVESITIFLKN